MEITETEIKAQIVHELDGIPNDKLAELYQVIHYFRLGLTTDIVQSTTQNKPIAKRPIGLAKGSFTVTADFFEPLPDDILAGFEG